MVVLWLWVAWVIFRRIGFFGAHKPPRFRVEKDGNLFTHTGAHYLINGVVDGRHVVFVFETESGHPFVYLPRDDDVLILADAGALERFVRDHCGGEKGIAKLREATAALRKHK